MSARTAAVTEVEALGHFGAVAAVSLANGTLLVEDGGAYDQASMRADQLSSLLMLMRTQDAEGFRNLNSDTQVNLMWLASQLADEVRDLLPLAAEEQRREKRA